MSEKPSISILKETRGNERRVALLPPEISQFRQAGFDIFVEQNAGAGCNASDNDYQNAGASIVSTKEAWSKSDFVVKYKFPSTEEYKFFRSDMNLCCYFYPGENYDLTHAMLRKGMTAYSYEYFQTDDGAFPLMSSDSELSGKMAIIHGAYHLQTHMGGSGVCLPNIVGARRAKVLVIGHGNSGGAAARLAHAMGAEVVVIGHRRSSLRKFQGTVSPEVKCYLNSRDTLEREVPTADLIIGAILISTYDTEEMVGADLVKQMRPGSMIIDVTCGYGSGYLPTANKPTKGDVPPYVNYGVKHYKNDVMPALVHNTASQGTSAALAPYLIELGRAIYNSELSDPVSEKGKFIENGKILHHHVLSDFALIEEQRKI